MRWRKEQEYFTIRVYQDLMGDWVVTQCWGHCDQDEGAYSHTVVESFDDARRMVKQLNLSHRKRGYRKDGQVEEQLGFDFWSAA